MLRRSFLASSALAPIVAAIPAAWLTFGTSSAAYAKQIYLRWKYRVVVRAMESWTGNHGARTGRGAVRVDEDDLPHDVRGVSLTIKIAADCLAKEFAIRTYHPTASRLRSSSPERMRAALTETWDCSLRHCDASYLVPGFVRPAKAKKSAEASVA